MKKFYVTSCFRCLATIFIILFLQLVNAVPAKAQGRILINEYLPWPNNSCGTTAEFIELFNFGPGPVNIGGYILTDGDYSITIPPNTIVLPGAFFVLAGQNNIPQNCGNDLRPITVNLNWSTCGCTSAPIPVTGDGLMTDGGGSNEQVILLDPSLKVIDAVVRSLPAESSSIITTSSLGGLLPVKILDLTSMLFSYETIGESVGRGNSMARRVDGGCGWIKDTQESAGDFNNTGAVVSELDASLYYVSPSTCLNTGNVVVTVNNALLFPINYTLAKDVDGNYQYDLNDSYQTGIDMIAPNVEVGQLTPGRYRLAIESELGCDLTMFDFFILACNSMVLNYQPRTRLEAVTFLTNPIVHPNPAKEQYWVEMHSRQKQRIKAVLSDVSGRTILNYWWNLTNGHNTCRLPAGNLPAGLYVLNLFNDQNNLITTEKLIKQ